MRLGVGSQCGFTCDVEGDEGDKADRGKKGEEEGEEGEEEAGGAEAVLMRAEPLMAPAPCLLLLLLWGYCLAVIDGEGQLKKKNYLSVCLSLKPFESLSVCVCLSLSLKPFESLSVCLSVCLSLSVSPTI